MHAGSPIRLVEVLPEVRQFLARDHGIFVDGEDRPASSDRRLAVRDPSTGEVVGQIADASAADLDRAVAAARGALDGEWGRLRPADRERLIHRFAELIEAHGEELAQLETINQGKSINISRAIEVAASVEYVRYMAGWATKIEGSTLDLSIPMAPGTRYTGLTFREPVGVVGAILPWNFLMMIALWKIAPALGCGCTVVLKPSAETPTTALRLAQLAHQAGLPKGVLNVVTGTGSGVGAALTRHPGIDKITFTGSTPVGRQVGVNALEHFTGFTLELGGKNPLIILSDVDVGAILPGLMMGCFLNQGQVCAAASRLFVDRRVFDSVVSGLQGALEGMRLGPGLDPTADLQPLVSAKHQRSVAGLVEAAVDGGATIVTGGKRPEMAGYYFEPTLIVGADRGNAAYDQEIFGPVIAAVPVDGLDDAVQRANDGPYGLTASIWSNDFGAVMKAIQRLRAGTVWVNSHVPVDPNLPFGGYKQSGVGREHGRAMIEQYTELKSVCIPTPMV
jgi:phenylacetaldehyde dehydrogenase